MTASTPSAALTPGPSSGELRVEAQRRQEQGQFFDARRLRQSARDIEWATVLLRHSRQMKDPGLPASLTPGCRRP